MIPHRQRLLVSVRKARHHPGPQPQPLQHQAEHDQRDGLAEAEEGQRAHEGVGERDEDGAHHGRLLGGGPVANEAEQRGRDACKGFIVLN